MSDVAKQSQKRFFSMSMIVSRLTGATVSVKAELGESYQHVQMGPHTPDHQCCRDGLHVWKNAKCMHVPPRSESMYSYRMPNQWSKCFWKCLQMRCQPQNQEKDNDSTEYLINTVFSRTCTHAHEDRKALTQWVTPFAPLCACWRLWWQIVSVENKGDINKH